MKSVFITATDTEVGKTTIASGILSAAIKRSPKLRACGFKPIAAGCEWLDGQWKNEDALALINASNVALDYSLVNPFALKSPIAPHIAAQQENRLISQAALDLDYHALKQYPLDLLVIEGAGGWQLPLNDDEYLSEWVVKNHFPIVLVVGLKLGCLNHALLTAQAISQAGGQLVGWIGNHVDPDMLYQDENIQSLKHRLTAPCLGIVPHLDENQSAAEFIDIAQLEKLV